MYVPLSPCPSCQRHVRTNTAACPFCAAALDPSALAVAPDLGGMRLGRAAMFAFAATVSAVACRSTQSDGVAPSTVVVDTPAPSASPSVAPSTAVNPPDDPGGMVALYGMPMPQPQQVVPDAAAAPPVDAATAPDVVVADAGRPAHPTNPAHPSRPARPTSPVTPNHGPIMVRYGTPPADVDFV